MNLAPCFLPVVTAGHDNCGSIDTTGSNALLTALGDAPAEAKTYAAYWQGSRQPRRSETLGCNNSNR